MYVSKIKIYVAMARIQAPPQPKTTQRDGQRTPRAQILLSSYQTLTNRHFPCPKIQFSHKTHFVTPPQLKDAAFSTPWTRASPLPTPSTTRSTRTRTTRPTTRRPPFFHAHAAAAVDVPGAAVPTLNADAPIVETLAAVDASSDSLDPGMLLSSTTRRSPP